MAIFGFLFMMFIAFLSTTISLILPYYFLRARTTHYECKDGEIVIKFGILRTRKIRFELYRVLTTEVDQDLIQRMLGEGTLVVSVYNLGEVRMPGLARISDLNTYAEQLRNLAFLMRTSPLFKGLVQ